MESNKANNLLDRHKKELSDLSLKFKEYCTVNEPFFKLDSNNKGTKTYVHKDPVTETPIIKSERVIQAPIETIFNLLIMDDEATKKWDNACEDSLLFGVEETKFFYGYYRLKSQALFSPRDFCFVTTFNEEENEDIYIVSKSYQDEEFKEFKGIVRCELYLMGYGLFPLNEKETLVKFVLHLNYGGSVPKFLFNMMASYMGESVDLISKYLEKNKVKSENGPILTKKEILEKYTKKK